MPPLSVAFLVGAEGTEVRIIWDRLVGQVLAYENGNLCFSGSRMLSFDRRQYRFPVGRAEQHIIGVDLESSSSPVCCRVVVDGRELGVFRMSPER
jgi:hypothetical protein